MAGGKRRGPRLDPTVEPRVIEAVLDELASVGRDHLSMDGIANRAGVSKATVYTRWRSKDELLLAAYQHLSRPFPDLDSGSLSTDLDTLCDTVLAGAADHRYAAVLTEFVAAAATDPSLRPHLHAVSGAWQEGIQRMLRAAQDRAELGDDTAVALLAEALSALTLTRVMFQRQAIAETLRDDLHTLVRTPAPTLKPSPVCGPGGPSPCGAGCRWAPAITARTDYGCVNVRILGLSSLDVSGPCSLPGSM